MQLIYVSKWDPWWYSDDQVRPALRGLSTDSLVIYEKNIRA